MNDNPPLISGRYFFSPSPGTIDTGSFAHTPPSTVLCGSKNNKQVVRFVRNEDC